VKKKEETHRDNAPDTGEATPPARVRAEQGRPENKPEDQESPTAAHEAAAQTTVDAQTEETPRENAPDTGNKDPTPPASDSAKMGVMTRSRKRQEAESANLTAEAPTSQKEKANKDNRTVELGSNQRKSRGNPLIYPACHQRQLQDKPDETLPPTAPATRRRSLPSNQ